MACEMLFPCKMDPTYNNFGLCDSCMESIEAIALRNAANMGPAESFGCYECGLLYERDEYLQHPCVKNAQT
jgi:predicted amidophosphoribosyltransferase